MKRTTRLPLSALALGWSALALAACDPVAPEVDDWPDPIDPEGMVVRMELPDGEEMLVLARSYTFVPRLEADFEYVQGEGTLRWIGGEIRRGGGIDDRWPFHWDPDSLYYAPMFGPCEFDTPPMRSREEVDAFLEAHGEDGRFCIEAHAAEIVEPGPPVEPDTTGWLVRFIASEDVMPLPEEDILIPIRSMFREQLRQAEEWDHVVLSGRVLPGGGADERYPFHWDAQVVSFSRSSPPTCVWYHLEPIRTEEDRRAFHAEYGYLQRYCLYGEVAEIVRDDWVPPWEEGE